LGYGITYKTGAKKMGKRKYSESMKKGERDMGSE